MPKEHLIQLTRNTTSYYQPEVYLCFGTIENVVNAAEWLVLYENALSYDIYVMLY